MITTAAPFFCLDGAVADNIGFGKVPSAMVRAGRMAGLKGAAGMVAYVLASHVNNQDWSTELSISTIVKESGYSETSVHCAIHQLIAHGVLLVGLGSGRGCVNRYTVVTSSDITTERVRRAAPFRDRAVRHAGLKGAAGRSKGCGGPEKRVRRAAPRQIEKTLTERTLSTEAGKPAANPAKPRVKMKRKAERVYPPDPIWDTVCKLFGYELASMDKGDRGMLNKVVKRFKDKGATPDEIRIRYDRYQRAWPGIALTPPALAKHWQQFAKELPKPHRPGRVEAPKGKYDKLPIIRIGEETDP